ncbi:hypothetical protein [Streptomyces sp. JJ36]|uniref:hypothetical protein n=1 Tax=Streptomyces sp. JJ36 TaxID=2736645 RepID=UPI001F22DB82|nr:hypothetical protein [Streptomyces sp. JJ36]
MLFGLSRTDVPYLVREGKPEEGADLVAEWRVAEPAWQSFFARTQMSRVLQVRMRLVPARHEVRALDLSGRSPGSGDRAGLTLPAGSTRGQVKTVSWHRTLGRSDEGGVEATETFRFDNATLKEAVRDTVLAAGWTWRGVIAGKL